jgi:hypothetical protein
VFVRDFPHAIFGLQHAGHAVLQRTQGRSIRGYGRVLHERRNERHLRRLLDLHIFYINDHLLVFEAAKPFFHHPSPGLYATIYPRRTGGNDGRLEFTNNFMQRLTEVIDLKKNAPTEASAALLGNALFDTPIKGLGDNPIGQFSPAASGGANASTGFDAKSAIKPWDFILALEGAMLFAAAAFKRLEGNAPGQLVYPFCVQSSGAGYRSLLSRTLFPRSPERGPVEAPRYNARQSPLRGSRSSLKMRSSGG